MSHQSAKADCFRDANYTYLIVSQFVSADCKSNARTVYKMLVICI